MYNLADFRLRDMAECQAILRRIGADATSMQQVAEGIVHFLYENLGQPTSDRPACALVRFFKTHSYDALPARRQQSAQKILGGAPEATTIPCLTLLATAGDKPQWNATEQSEGHQAIPLASERMIEQFPMISQLIGQLGIDVATVLKPDPTLLVDAEQHTFNVFHVPQALHSPYVPAQKEFVKECGIQSVLGFGGMLPTGDLFATILFSKVSISRDTAEMFRTLALSVKLSILPFAEGPVFA